MIIAIKNATFGEAIRLPNNKVEQFITSENSKAKLEYNTEAQLLMITIDGYPDVVAVGITNIKVMTVIPAEKKEKK